MLSLKVVLAIITYFAEIRGMGSPSHLSTRRLEEEKRRAPTWRFLERRCFVTQGVFTFSHVRKVYAISASLVTASLRHRRIPGVRVSLPPTCVASPPAFAISSSRRSRASSSSISGQQEQRPIRASRPCPSRSDRMPWSGPRWAEVRLGARGHLNGAVNWTIATIAPDLASPDVPADWPSNGESLEVPGANSEILHPTAN